MPLKTGSRLGGYDIEAPLGAGGMGLVWRARDRRLGRAVAIKVLPDDVAGDSERVLRFGREARSLAALNHPHVAQIYGFEEADGVLFLVLELVEGVDLSRRISEGPLPLAEAQDVARQIAEALEAAHERGIVHRDLKPANIRLATDGTVKVLDFGLAKALDATASGPRVEADGSFFCDFATAASTPAKTTAPADGDSLGDRRTLDGVVLGTPTYMAPEQARGRPIDKRVDIWAFGCVLYECLTGRRAFVGGTVTDVLAAVVEREPDFSLLPANTPPRLRALLARCFEKDPRNRLRDIGEARLELERAETTSNKDRADAGRKGGSRRTATFVVLAMTAAAIGTAYALLSARGDAGSDLPALRASLELPTGLTLVEDARPLAVSPDGTQVVVSLQAKTGASPPSLYLRELSRLEFRALAGTEDASFPFWSPDGRSIGFFAGRKLKRIDLADGVVRVLCDAPAGRGGSWGVKGTVVFAPGASGGLQVVGDAGGAPTAITGTATLGESHRVPQALPDGESFLYYVQGSTADGVYAWDPESRRSRQILPGMAEAVYVEPGYLAFVRDENLLVQPFDARRLETTGAAQVIAAGVQYSKGRAFVNAGLSSRGPLVYQPVNPPVRYGLSWVDDKGARTSIPAEPIAVNFEGVSLTKDGRRLAAGVAGNRAEASIAIVDLERGITTLLGDPESSFIFGPIWAPGEETIFCSQITRTRQEFLQLPLGGGSGKLLFETEPGYEFAPGSVTPDGKTLLFTQTPLANKTGEIMTFGLEGGRAPEVFMATPDPEWEPRISPTGDVLAYVVAGEDDPGGALMATTYPIPSSPVKIAMAGDGHQGHWISATEICWTDASRRAWKATIVSKEGRLEVSSPRPLFEGRPLEGKTAILGYDLGRNRYLVATEEAPRADARLIVVADWRRN